MLGLFVHCPIGTLSWVTWRPWNFTEAFIKREIVTNRVLPTPPHPVISRENVR
uniref:Uncharacterized protein n=1 Tax=Anguilla anguilla TaxID=7936 RepID=A0A0E9U162_ANGAN